MDESRLIELLIRRARGVPQRSRFCPDEGKIGAYFEGLLEPRARGALERHLVECRHCQARIGNLARLDDAADCEQVPGDVLAEAKRLIPLDRPARIRSAPAWGLVAAVLLAIPILLTYGPEADRKANPLMPHVPEHPRVLRSMGSLVKPDIIRPVEGEIIEPGGLSVRWTPVRESLHYDVRVVDEAGFIIRSERIEGVTEWTPPVSHLIEPGQTYYVRVDAYLAGANTVSSDHVLFTVRDPQR